MSHKPKETVTKRIEEYDWHTTANKELRTVETMIRCIAAAKRATAYFAHNAQNCWNTQRSR